MDIEDKIIEFFKNNPSPKDHAEVHKYAEELGIEDSKFEEMIYKLIGSFLGYGKSKDFKGTYDPKQLEAGIKIEMEHTNNTKIAERIAKDHLAEFSTYYTYLAEMEKKAKSEMKENKRYKKFFKGND
jgi:hypothetical protein